MFKNKSIRLIFGCLIFVMAAFILFHAGKASAGEAPPCLNYTILGSSSLDTPMSQTVVVSIGEMDKSKLKSAVLTYKNRSTKKQFTAEAKQIYRDAALFTMDFDDSRLRGSYELTKISFVYNGVSQEISYQETGKTVRFAVDEKMAAVPDAVIEGMSFEGEDQVVQVEATDTKPDIKGALLSAPSLNMKGKSRSGEKVIVLDPGHGGYDSGAAANGLKEKELTLKIANYCKKELEKYSGAKVYLTRSNDTYISLEGRVKYAASVGADVFVSIHINSAANTMASGAEVYYPNSNYRPSLGTEGKTLALAIEKKLVALGLADRGVKIRNSATGNTYADGSPADYYGVIRQAKQAGFPGIIVEHAFISNASDAKKYLGSDEALKKLGIADAAGIAETYGLKKKTSLDKTKITQLTGKDSTYVYLKWKKVSGAQGYEIYRSTSKDKDFKKIKTVNKGSTVSFKDKSVKAGKTYYYKVRAYKKSGGETVRAGFCGVQKTKVLKKPSVPSASSSKTQVKLKWKKINGAKKYQIYRSNKKNGSYKKIATVKNVLTYKDKSVSKNKTYYYKIRAVGDGTGGNTYSSYSGVRKIKTKK
ncbi:MAG: N-acetylmuramoyl-L-alanine amidase [Roseburia sp. 1XD42-69]|jgi:N-acetylmuramoyl-L-alanine amidase